MIFYKCLCIFIGILHTCNIYCQDIDGQIVLDSIYTINISDSTKGIVEWLKSIDGKFKGKDKYIRQCNELIELDYYWSAHPRLIVGAWTNFDQSLAADDLNYVFNEHLVANPYVDGHYLYGLSYCERRLRVLRDIVRYNKRPVVWILNGKYSMTTGFNYKWPPHGEELAANNFETSFQKIKSLDEILLPRTMGEIKDIRFTEDLSFLYTVFHPKQRIFLLHPLVIFITTK